MPGMRRGGSWAVAGYPDLAGMPVCTGWRPGTGWPIPPMAGLGLKGHFLVNAWLMVVIFSVHELIECLHGVVRVGLHFFCFFNQM